MTGCLSPAPGFLVNYSSSSCRASCSPCLLPADVCLVLHRPCSRFNGFVSLSLTPPLPNPPTCVPSPGAKLSAQAPLSLSRNAAGDAPHFCRVARTCACGAGSDILSHLWLSLILTSHCASARVRSPLSFLLSRLLGGDDDDDNVPLLIELLRLIVWRTILILLSLKWPFAQSMFRSVQVKYSLLLSLRTCSQMDETAFSKWKEEN